LRLPGYVGLDHVGGFLLFEDAVGIQGESLLFVRGRSSVNSREKGEGSIEEDGG
jgi:hypothetical protein